MLLGTTFFSRQSEQREATRNCIDYKIRLQSTLIEDTSLPRLSRVKYPLVALHLLSQLR